MNSVLRTFLPVAALTFAGVAPVEAQERDSTARDSARTLGSVVVRGTRSSTTIGGASAVTVRMDSLRLSVTPTLDETLRHIPFVLVRQNSRGEAEISVRGSDSRQSAVLVDGVPLTLGWDHRTDPSLVPIGGASQIVFVRGLSSLLQGPNVLGGVLELGLLRSTMPGQPPSVSARAGVDNTGAMGYGLHGVLPDAFGRAGLSMRAGGEFRQRDGFRLSSDVNDPSSSDDLRTNSDLRELDAYAAVRAQRANGGWLGFSATGYSAERGVPPELHASEPRMWRYPEQSRLLAVASGGTGRVHTPWGDGDAELILGANVGHTEIESFETLDYTTVSGTEEGDERTLTARLLADHSLGRGEVRTAFTLASVHYDETLDADPSSEYAQRLWSVAGEIEQPIVGFLRASAGLALDGASTPKSGGKESLDDLTELGWRVGLSTLALGATTRLHASVSRRARFPALRELYSGALGRFEPNPSLRPERLIGAEIGATVARSNVQFQAVVFHNDLDDAVVRVTQPDRRFKRINRDQIASTGLEMLAGWNGARASLVADLLVQRVRVTDRTAGNAERRAEHMPEFRAGVDGAIPLVWGVRGTAGLDFTGSQYCLNPDSGVLDRLDGSTRADVGVDRDFALRGDGGGLWSRIRASLGVSNVADAGIYDQCGLPQPGRTVRFGVSIF
ncbi:MAG TPA: TonB-dependent receptor [Gemmatimonadaceae bacterium]|nr:TonB-dependent receptor [Gemmatimonadaceae bacterium]